MLNTITERKTFTFRRMASAHVTGYNILKAEEGSSYELLVFVPNPIDVNPVETLMLDASETNGYIDLPHDAITDGSVIPTVIADEAVLTYEKDYTYSPALKKVRLGMDVSAKQYDLIYHRDMVELEVDVIHDAANITLFDYRVEPVYQNTHLIGSHTYVV